MKNTFLLVVLLSLLLSFGVGVFAQEIESPKAGTTPDSPFYFLEIIWEEIGTFFTFGNIKKAERRIALAAERLAETGAVAEKGKMELVEKSLERYKNQLDKALRRIEKAETKGKNTKEVAKTMAEVTYEHLVILNKGLGGAPEEIKPNIERAMTTLVKGHGKAVEILEAKDALSEISGAASLPTEIPQEVKERIQTRVQQELQIEEFLEEPAESFESIRNRCIEEGGPSEMCEKIPLKGFKSFKALEDFCIDLGAPEEMCTILEDQCKEFGVITPDECFRLLTATATATYKAAEPTSVTAPSLTEEEMKREEEMRRDEKRGE